MEECLAEEKQTTIENTPECFTTTAADGGDRSAMAAPLADDSPKSKRRVVEDDCSSSKSKKPKISKGKRKVDDCDSKKGVINKQKVSIKKTGPKFKRPLDFSYFETAEDLEILGMRRLQNELLDRGKSCKDTYTLQERAAKLFEFKLDFPEVNELYQIYDKLQQKWIQLPC